MLSVLRRKSAESPLVGLLAYKGQTSSIELPVASPSPAGAAEWSNEATRPCLQWRNRAGLTPDFPVMPVMGTQGDEDVTTITRE